MLNESNESQKDVMLTTIDNPYNPFTQFDEWFMFDVEKGYNTCSYLARLSPFSEDSTLKEESDDIELVIDEIVACNPLGIYIKVTKDDARYSENRQTDM